MKEQRSEKIKKILKICFNCVFYVFIVLLLLFSFANMKIKDTADIPNIFGRGFLSVASDSMEGDYEDSFGEGDLIIVNMLNDSERNNLQVGDIVTFFDTDLLALNTHRIVEINGDFIYTQGDKAAMNEATRYDPDALINDPLLIPFELMTREEILSSHVSTWSGAGTTLTFLQSPSGFAIFIVLPTFLILVYEAILLIKNFLKVNRQKMEDQQQKEMLSLQEQLQKEKEEMRAKILDEIKNEKEKLEEKSEEQEK